jgi:hypothetical protein
MLIFISLHDNVALVSSKKNDLSPKTISETDSSLPQRELIRRKNEDDLI